jgi:hypothetical protein
MEYMMELFKSAHISLNYDFGSYIVYRLPNKVIHRGGDRPAIVYSDGAVIYMQMGVIHRDGDNPAVITKNGCIGIDGLPENRFFHQKFIINANIWFKNGLIHRDGDQPAAVSDDVNMWYHKGQRHRECGPACIYANGTLYWYNHNVKIASKVV